MAGAFNIEDFVIKTVPPKAYYIPNFITAEDEKELLDQIYGAPKPKWTKLSGRQLQNWGGLPHPKGMVVEKLPPWLQKYVIKVGMLPVFNGVMPNHVLVNEYQPGQGIMPHEDGPLFYPVVSTINLGSHTFLDFYHPVKSEGQTGEEHSDQLPAGMRPEDRYFMSLLLEPRSLFLLTEQLYHNFLHGIEERTCDVVSDIVRNRDMCNVTPGETLERSTRISLTIRNVPKTLKFKLNLGR